MMALCLYEENGRYRVYDEETKYSSPAAEKIEDLLHMLDRKRDIRLYIGFDAFSIRKTVLPNFEREKLMEILPFEMEGLFLSPSSAFVFDFYPLRSVENGMEGIVFEGIAANDSTLLITVGLPNRPLCAGSGGLARTMPRRPSRLSRSEVSSPQT